MNQIEGAYSFVLMSPRKMIAVRDPQGFRPLCIGKMEDSYIFASETCALDSLGAEFVRDIEPGEIVVADENGIRSIRDHCGHKSSLCIFEHVYFARPDSVIDNASVHLARQRAGKYLAREYPVEADLVAGVPDSGLDAAIGYANESGIPFARPFIKYTPTWPRSFMPQNQSQRNLIAKMKLIPVDTLIRDKSLLLIDDSIVRGTQLGETTEFLYQSGAREVHIRPACPPLLFGCKYLNFSRSNSDLDLITRRIIREREGDNVSPELLADYANPDSQNYKEMVEEIRRRLNFTSLKFHRLDDLIESIGLPRERLCTYCWDLSLIHI